MLQSPIIYFKNGDACSLPYKWLDNHHTKYPSPGIQKSVLLMEGCQANSRELGVLLEGKLEYLVLK